MIGERASSRSGSNDDHFVTLMRRHFAAFKCGSFRKTVEGEQQVREPRSRRPSLYPARGSGGMPGFAATDPAAPPPLKHAQFVFEPICLSSCRIAEAFRRR